ncbi:enoyl-CoA hydratase-related protein [Mycobacteroides chelonae]|uniref:enoyl-CoA hydratase-related protein n=1 Tax=Mycobacteroides chelonae TaxID=1774 RepID=UPI000991FE84|nr:enoyl-CoA hydratase-related protein [Mycobacteroides chelonae]
MPYLSRQDNVFILNLGEEGTVDTENRITPTWVAEVNICLDEVEDSTGAAALVTTGAGKFYSNGFEPQLFAGAPGDVAAYLLSAQLLFARVLAFPLPTVAALQGHTYAAGAIFAMAHDARVMRTDRGFFCLPEINLGLALPDGLIIPGGMAELLLARLPGQTAHQAILAGRRYGGPEARDAGIVDVAVGCDDVLPVAVERAAAVAQTRGPALGTMKKWIYRDIIKALESLN